MITGIHHVNIIIPPGTDNLTLATYFYAQVLELTARPVPASQKDRLAWFDIGTSGQQVHVAFGREGVDFTEVARKATRHPCFRVESLEALQKLQERVWGHFVHGRRGQHEGGGELGQGQGQGQGQGKGQEGVGVEGEEEGRRIRRLSAPMECDEPGKENSGAKGPEYPTRFFARDFAGNRLEFTT